MLLQFTTGMSRSEQHRSRMQHGILRHIQRGNSNTRDPLRHRLEKGRYNALDQADYVDCLVLHSPLPTPSQMGTKSEAHMRQDLAIF